MMNSPNGTTREAVASALGRRTMPPLNRILTEAGIAFEAQRNGRTEIYRLRSTTEAAATGTAPQAITFEAFAAKLGMATDEVEFWNARRAALTAAPATRQYRTRSLYSRR